LKDGRRVAARATDNAAIAEADARARAAPEAARKAEAERRAAETAKVKEGLAAIAQLRRDGKTAEANTKARELLANHPQSVAVQVLNGVSIVADQLAAD